MKRTVNSQETACDVCGELTYEWDACKNCGKDLCDAHRREYHRMVFFETTEPGWCFECDALMKRNPSPLYAAVQAIQRLRNEYTGFWADFKKRQEEAESQVTKFLGR